MNPENYSWDTPCHRTTCQRHPELDFQTHQFPRLLPTDPALKQQARHELVLLKSLKASNLVNFSKIWELFYTKKI
jgi:hypothetical protein